MKGGISVTDGETFTYRLEIILSTEAGELPTQEEVRQLVIDQMAGELDPTTGLKCLGVATAGAWVTKPPSSATRTTRA